MSKPVWIIIQTGLDCQSLSKFSGTMTAAKVAANARRVGRHAEKTEHAKVEI
ncbi:MAG TPA: hypothetical protein VEN30_03535 [Paraburkholderia sp.]|nr:hypothetical protein [Paraburkholderia sp.]